MERVVIFSLIQNIFVDHQLCIQHDGELFRNTKGAVGAVGLKSSGITL